MISAVALLALLRSYGVEWCGDLRRGGLIPPRLPRRARYVAHALAITIQLSATYLVLSYAVWWEAETQNIFFESLFISCLQDFFLNEPVKLWVAVYAGPLGKTLSKSFIGKAFGIVLDVTGVKKLVSFF
eukprot:gene19133-43373_t